MAVRYRPELASLPAYVPGRRVPGAVKLASNESSYGPLPYVIERIAAEAADANRYPDTHSSALRERLAEHLSTQAERIVVGCGSVSLCQQLVLATAGSGDEVLFGWRSFEAYPIISILGGATPVMVGLKDDAYDLTAMAAAITDRTRLIFVCNPNNPTGTVVSDEELLRFLDAVPDTVLVVLDEAYREFVTDAVDGVSLLDRYPNLIVLRTFSKAYGLAGLRVGYGVAADPSVVAAAAQTQAPFAVTSVGQVAAMASLDAPAQQQMRERVAEVHVQRRRVTDAVRAAGYSVPQSQANFIWLDRLRPDRSTWQLDPVVFAAECERNSVIVRPFADSGVRVTIGTPAENDQFLAALPDLTPR